MRVLIVRSVVSVDYSSTNPAQNLQRSLADFLTSAGHQVDTAMLPYVEESDRKLEQVLAHRLLNVTNYADRLIAIDFPACVVNHPHNYAIATTNFCFAHQCKSAATLGTSHLQQTEILRRLENAKRNSLLACNKIFCENQQMCEQIKKEFPEVIPRVSLFELSQSLLQDMNMKSKVSSERNKTSQRIAS